MSNPHIRFWAACLAVGALSFLATVFLTAWAPYLIFLAFVACFAWLVLGHASAAGGLARLPRTSALIVGAGGTLALLFFCAFGAILGIGMLTGFQD
jgi:hypothetical protein